MYAVFSTGGKQYRAAPGDIIKVEKLDAEKGATVELDQVLLVGEGQDVQVGSPYVDGGKVTARVVDHGRGEKVKVIKFKRRKHHMKQMGHRQYFTMLEITGIEGVAPAKQKTGKVEEPAAKKADKPAPPKAKKAAAPKKATPVEAVEQETQPEAKVEKEPALETGAPAETETAAESAGSETEAGPEESPESGDEAEAKAVKEKKED